MSERTLVPVQSGFNAMQTNIVVTMDDVVSAFVSKYETQLFARKKELSAELTAVNEAIKEHADAVRAKVDTQVHNKSNLPFDLVAEASKDVTLDFEKGRASFGITIRPASERKQMADANYYYRTSGNTITVTQYEDISAADVEIFNQNERLHERLEKDLAEVLDKIKSVTRKEREVRGRIAMRKIEESGYASLLDDSQLLQLVQL